MAKSVHFCVWNFVQIFILHLKLSFYLQLAIATGTTNYFSDQSKSSATAGYFSDQSASSTVPQTTFSSTESTPIPWESFPVTKPRKFEFFWNKTVMSPLLYQTAYCPYKCDGDTLIYSQKLGTCQDIFCYHCTCNRPTCEILGVCCPYIDDQNNTLAESDDLFDSEPPQQNQTLISYSLTEMKEETVIGCDLGERIMYVRSCPVQFSNKFVKDRCEQDTPVSDQDTATFLKVTNGQTGVTYFNQHCARCNKVFKFTVWEMSVSCLHYQKVYQALTYDELLKLSLQSSSGCYVLQQLPRDLTVAPCKTWWFDTAIDTCNVTGQWITYDDDVLNACEQETSIKYRVLNAAQQRKPIYKNIFCAICNMATFPLYYTSCNRIPPNKPEIHLDFPAPLPFSFLLNLGTQNHPIQTFKISHMTSQCRANIEWSSPDNRCLNLHCSPGKRLVQGKCTTALEQIRGLGYRLRLLHIPNRTFEIKGQNGDAYPFKTVLLKKYRQRILEILLNNTVNINAKFSIVTKELGQTEMGWSSRKVDSGYSLSAPDNFSFSVLGFVVDAYLNTNVNNSRDDFEDNVLSSLLADDIVLHTDEMTPLSLIPQLFSGDQEIPFTCNTQEPVQDEKDEFMFKCDSLEKGVSVFASEVQVQTQPQLWENAYLTETFLALIPELTCTFVVFDSSDYTLESNDSVFPPTKFITLHLNTTTFSFSESKELNLVSIDGEGSLKICQNLLDTKGQQWVQVITSSAMRKGQYILTILSLGASFVCLLMTLTTYCLFSVLRSVAGKNNMFLSGTLLLAQGCLLASSHVTITGYLCTALGIATHFLWLSMFCWSFLCCFHMCRVFTAKTRMPCPTPRSERVQLCKRCIFCLTVPAAIVTIVIVASLLLSNKQDIGYGRSLCYLDSVWHVALAMVTPLGIILLCNCVFFIITVIKIHNVRKLQTHESFKKDDHQNLYVYIKLSSMTGAFWLIAIVAEVSNMNPLRLIAIILNGLQGVFIFFSYICNKRVLRLYKHAVGFQEPLPDTLTTNTGTISKAKETNTS